MSLLMWLRGDYFWRHERRWEYRFALALCALFGCTANVHDGGDCRRCWR